MPDRSSLSQTSQALIAELHEDAPSSLFPRESLGQPCANLVSLLCKAGLSATAAHARHGIISGGVWLNNEVINDITRVVTSQDLILDEFFVIRRGRTSHHVFRVIP